jgi:1,5-anhydro-D-fructose reductase (1,5-anhydro-D-mannitol-forming)
MTNSLSWGLIGASDIAATRVIGALRNRGDEISGVFSNSAAHGDEFASSAGIPRSTTDLDSFLASSMDAVYISSRNDQHFDKTMRALQAGKHVLCEKPLALTVAEAEQMISFAKAQKLVLATNHHLPGSPLHVTVRQLVTQGRIGTVLSARVKHAVLLPERLRGWRIGSSAGGGVIMDITCHDASVLNPLLGVPRRVTAVSVRQADWNNGSAADAAMTVIEYQPSSGPAVLAQTHDAFSVTYDHTALEVQGTKGSIVVTDAMTQDTAGTVVLTTAAGTENIDVDCSADLYSIVLDAFASAVSGDGVPTATGSDGLLALKVALAANESITDGRTVDID